MNNDKGLGWAKSRKQEETLLSANIFPQHRRGKCVRKFRLAAVKAARC